MTTKKGPVKTTLLATMSYSLGGEEKFLYLERNYRVGKGHMKPAMTQLDHVTHIECLNLRTMAMCPKR